MPLPSHARSFTLSARLLRNTKTSPQYGFARNASLTSADSVCTDLRKSTGCAASTTLRSGRKAINGCPEAPTAPWKASPAPLQARPGCVPLSPRSRSPRQACLGWCHLRRHFIRGRQPIRLFCRRQTALGSDPYRHEGWCLKARCRRELVPPNREQPTDNAMAPSDLGDIGPFLEALRHDRAFSSDVHCRRRRGPVITSIRR
jgi:hypothetical protein